MAVEVKGYAFTADESHRMARAGSFAEGERVGLIGTTPVEPAHVAAVNWLAEVFLRGLPAGPSCGSSAPSGLGSAPSRCPIWPCCAEGQTFTARACPVPKISCW